MIRLLTTICVTVAAATFALAGATAPARAAEPGTVRISTAGIDLGSAAGRNIVGSRIAAAATRLCGDWPRHAKEARDVRVCRADVMAQGARQLAARTGVDYASR